jgi:hypothetical protein
MPRAGLECVAGALLFFACGQQPAATSPPDGARGAALAGSGEPGPPGQPVPSVDGPAPDAAGRASPAPPVMTSPTDSGVAGSMPAHSSDAGPSLRVTRVSLVDHSRWTPLGPEKDPFADRPPDSVCAPEAVGVELLAEELAYGVDTGGCSYLTARQVTLHDVAAGETVIVRLWHFALDAPSAGEAHAVVDVDGLRLMEERVPIPAAGGLIKAEVLLDRAVPSGSPVHFHLHNHGANSWALLEISAGP